MAVAGGWSTPAMSKRRGFSLCLRTNRSTCAAACARDEWTYADAATVGSIDAWSLVDVAARSGARGVLVDTADKLGEGLTALWSCTQILSWVAEARGWGLIAALAGKLGPDDFGIVRDAGVDVIGVRGAACATERTSRVSADRVRILRSRLNDDVTVGIGAFARSALRV